MRLRRVVDVTGACLVLVGLSPLLVALAVANRLLVGRVLFRQTRVGQDLRPFVLFKFQTMVDGAERGSTVTVARDPRITSWGRILRGLKLDELPQLVNVIRGEMTLVGPRPLTPNEIAVIPRHLAAVVYRARPGLTGASAVAFADEERILAQSPQPDRAYFDSVLPRKIALELAYAQRHTWVTDLILLLFSPLAGSLPAVRRAVLVRLVPEWAGLADGGPSRGWAPAGGSGR